MNALNVAVVAGLALAAASGATATPLAPLYNSAAKRVANQYIVRFRDGYEGARHLSTVDAAIASRGDSDVAALLHQYKIGSFQGYAVRADPELLELIRSLDGVAYVEQDSYVAATAVQNNPPSWGLDRIDQRALPLNSAYAYKDAAGEGVNMYTLDTGIQITHNDFGGRAFWGITVPAGASDADRNGHGTHVSGTMAGTTYGVAKKAAIYAVKVLGDSGSGTTANVIAGVNWATDTGLASGKPSVANMSLGGGRSASLDDAVNAGVDEGVHFAVAAGNDSGNACNYSPAAAANAITVGSTTQADGLSSFSNRGDCVDILAPGSLITSAWIGTDSAVSTISGTSMASPHVAGVIALWLSVNDESPSSMADHLSTSATQGAISGVPAGTANLLLYNEGQ